MSERPVWNEPNRTHHKLANQEEKGYRVPLRGDAVARFAHLLPLPRCVSFIQLSGICCFTSASDSLRRDRGTDCRLELRGGSHRIRGTNDAYEIAAYLNGRHDQPPREAPPPRDQRDRHVPKLGLHTAAAARDASLVPPGRHDQN